MEKKVSEKFTILKLSLLITFLIAMIVTTVIMGNRSEVNAATAYDDNGILWRFSYNTNTNEITSLYTTSLTEEQAQNLVIPSTLTYYGVEYTVRSVGSGYSSSSYMFPKKIRNLTIPDTVTAINDYAFYQQTQLKTITMGANVQRIGNYAFNYCYNAEGTLTLGENLTYIGNYAFSSCNKLEGTIDLHEGLTTIGNYAFSSCYKLTGKVTFPKSLTTIGSGILNSCSSITGAKITDTVPLSVITNVYGYDNFQTLEVYDDSELYKVEDGTLYSKDGKRLYLAAKKDYNNYTIPEGVTSVEANAFRYAKSMTGTLTLPEGLLSIGNSAFYGQSGLTGHLRIPDSVTTLGSYAFSDAKNFDRVTVGSGITSIPSGVFTGLTDLFINNVIGSVQFTSGYCNPEPVVHFLNSTKHVIVNKAPGVKLINVETGTEIETGDYLDETTFRYRIEVENGYTYNNLQLVWFDDHKYEDFTKTAVTAGQEYEFTPLLRERSIFVQNLNDAVDLSLRTFITEVNRTQLSKSRVPVTDINATFEYKHTKEPVKVKKGDLVTYKVRVYNEALQAAKATEITVHIPSGMSFDEENTTNKNYGWIKDENKVTTSQLAFENINAYLGNGVINYKDVEICLTVTDDSLESEIYKTVFAEITGVTGTDSDSTPGNVTVSQNYRIDEITNSNTTSFIFDQEDDDDFDTVVLNSKIRVEYNIRIEKVDKDTDELLAGARFELLSAGVNELVENGEIKRYEDEEVIARVTSDENGIVDFGGIVTYGAGENIYWVKEIDAPSGYLTNIGKKMKVKVVKTILDEETGIYSVAVYCESSDYMVDTTHFEFTPVSNAEQLAKVGCGEVVNVNGVDYEYNSTTNYKLTNDIDLTGINWIPIDRDLVGIFDGDGHKISNLTISANEQSTYAKLGLFAEYTGIIENLTLENPNVHLTGVADGLLENTDYYGVGGFVGYMKNGYFYNCKTTVTEGSTANITSVIDNIGGFVGHTAPNGLVTIINCENNVDVIGAEHVEEEGVTTAEGSNNVGGLIGCSLGSISIQNSKNTAKISSGKYGAGGLVGFVKPSDYEELAITAGYDEDNKRIDLLVENEAAKGQYNLTLEIRDKKTDRLIGGAIYEVDKIEDNIKTALVDTGTLKLFDKAIEYTGRDVYFMTEEETVPGYDLLNGIIRVDIDRYWDVDANAYRVRAEASIITHKEYEEFVGERSTKEDETKTGKTFDRGDIFTEANVARANWNGSKIEIINCINDGQILAGKSNAAGMIGTSYGVVTATDCINNGEINGQYKSGGLVAELRAVDMYMNDPAPISAQNSMDYSVFTNCINNGKVEGIATGWLTGVSGGLVAECAGSLKVLNATNNGEVSTEKSHTGGVVGKVLGIVTIEDTINNGTITVKDGSTADAGGIVGVVFFDEYGVQSIKYEQINSVFKNCKNYGDLYSYNQHDIGGIVGLAAGKSIVLTNCETLGKDNENKLKMYAYGKSNIAGIIAWSSCKTVTIKDCKVKNLETKIVPEDDTRFDTDCNVAGIFANNDAGYIPCYEKQYERGKRELTTISNCTVEDSIITGVGKEVSGIMGITNGSYGSLSDEYMANIQDCNVKNSLIGVYAEGRGGSGGGVIASGIYAGGYECRGFNIRYCNVENTRIEHRGYTEEAYGCTGTSSVAGIFGRGMYAKHENIEECNVINCSIYSKTPLTSSTGCTGGIYGVTYGVNKDLNIKKCNVKNTQITEHNSNSGGILGGIMNCGYSSEGDNGLVTIEDCNVIETNINRLGTEEEDVSNYGNHTNDCCVGGIAGSIQDMNVVTIKNVNVIGKNIAKDAANANERNTISVQYGDVGGAVGMTRNNTLKISNVVIKNYDIINNVSEHKNYNQQSQIGGAFGSVWYGGNQTELYKDITIENVNIKGNKTINTAGFAASFFTYEDSLIDNVNVKNTDISSEYTYDGEDQPTSGVIAGLIACNGMEDIITNCNVEDCTISSKHHIAAGAIGHNNYSVNAKKCSVKNVEIIDAWEEPENIQDTVSVLGLHRQFTGFVGVTPTELEAEDINVSNVNINAKYASVSGIYGYVGTLGKLNNTTVDNCEFTTAKSISGIRGECVGIGACTTIMSGTPTNNKVSNVKLTTDNHISSGMFGFIKNENGTPITINDATVENVTLTHENKSLLYNIDHREDDETALIEYNPLMAGIVAITEQDLTINNATVKNTTITGKDGKYMHIGGIVALTAHDINIDNAKVINTNITNNTSSAITGGLVGINIPVYDREEPVTTITNSSIEQNSTITANNCFGGLVGYAKAKMNNNKVLNLTLTLNKYTSLVGGVIGLTKTAANEINNTTIRDVSIPDGDYLSPSAGGVAGVFYGTLKNTTITNAEVNSSSCAAGAVAIYQNANGTVSEIDNITITNATVTSKGNHAGGVTAVSYGKISNAKVIDSTITSDCTVGGITSVDQQLINEVEVDGTTVLSKGENATWHLHAGGVAGVTSAPITNAKVTDSNVTAKAQTGGVVGVTVSSISDVEIDNVNATSKQEHAGGVVGVDIGSVTNATVKDSTIKAGMMAGGVGGFIASPTNNVEVNNTNVTGVDDAGGIAGVTSGTITTASVKDSTITGKRLAGGIVGTTEQEIKDATVDGSTIISEELHVGGIIGCTKTKLNHCTAKNSTIKTLSGTFTSGNDVYPTCLGGLVGAGYKNPTTNELQPQIVNSTVENNTLTGATGTSVGKYIGGPIELNDQLIAAETTQP